MSTLDDIDQVEVSVGGAVHRGWTTYSIDSDLMVPADAWQVSLAQADIGLPSAVVPGAEVRVSMTRNGSRETVLVGKLDEVRHLVSSRGQLLNLVGRDGAGVLLDCSAAVVSMRQLGLAEVVARLVRPLGIGRIRIDAAGAAIREKANVEPGDTAWDSLRRAAEANGLWPWFEPDGTLVVGGPRYDTAPVETLVLRGDGQGNNVLELEERRSIAERYSEVTVLGQAHAGGTGATERDGRHNVRAVVRDTGVQGYRPLVLVDHEAISADIARARGRKLLSDSRLRSYGLVATVRGHRTAAGVLWAPGQRVALRSDPHAVNATFFLMGRRFVCDRNGGQRTQLNLVEDGVWVLDAHPSRRKHRRGKNSLPGKIVDLSVGAAQ